MDNFETILPGIVLGLTEFLPVRVHHRMYTFAGAKT